MYAVRAGPGAAPGRPRETALGCAIPPGRPAPLVPRLRLGRLRHAGGGRDDRPAQGRRQGRRRGRAPALCRDDRAARDGAAALGHFRPPLHRQRAAAPRLRRRPGRRAQRQRRQQRRAAPAVHRRGDDGPLDQRRRVVRPRRRALPGPRPRDDRGDPPRLRRPRGGLRLRDRAEGGRPALRAEEGLGARRRPGRRRDLRLLRPAVDPAADAPDPARPRRRDRHALGRPGRDPAGRGRAPGRARAGRDHREHGRGDEGGLRPLHAQGDPRAARGRDRAAAPARALEARRCDGRADDARAPPLPGRLRDQLPRLHAGGGLLRAAGAAAGDPRAGAAVHRAVRAGSGAGGRRAVRQPERRDQGRAERAGRGAPPRGRDPGAGQRPRLDAAARERALPAAGLRLRDQRPGDQDLHEPGAGLPLPGPPDGGAPDRRAGAPARAARGDDPHDRAAGRGARRGAARPPGPLRPGLRPDLPDRAGGGAQAQGDHLRPLRGDALDPAGSTRRPAAAGARSRSRRKTRGCRSTPTTWSRSPGRGR